jgi:phenylalanyl-tRNA synthetase alpha chain
MKNEVAEMQEELMDLEGEILLLTGGAMQAYVTRIEDLRIAYLGKKGKLTAVLRRMGKLTPSDRATVGDTANVTRDRIVAVLDTARSVVD